ncbi:MAG: 4-hydroxy-4-methyl-2-oxoglutarate aldolase, partial [Pirellulaceae bacterium]
MAITQETLDKLAQFDTPTICNVIELFDVRARNVGYMDERVKSNFPELPPMVGFATTASFRSDAPPVGGDAYGSIQSQLEQFASLPGPPVVVFEDLDDPAVAAVFGEVMCSTYQAFGSVGLVTNGAGRDLEQVRALRYPVFTSSTICSHAYCHILHIGLPVRVGGLMVNQGELLHGDANGITNIPIDIATEVADICGDFIKAEEIMLDYVKASGDKTVAKFSDLREEFQAAVAELK